MARLDYVELPATDIAATRGFYERAFDWSMMQFAPTYAATTTTDTNIGLQSDSAEKPAAPLAVIQVVVLAAALAAVETAVGKVVMPISSFSGGCCIHFHE